MSNFKFDLSTELGTDLSSRRVAGEFRERLLAAIGPSEDDVCVLDLDRVRSVSHSFADELFAVLIETHGESWFKSHLQLQNLSPDVRETILEAIQQRQHLCR